MTVRATRAKGRPSADSRAAYLVLLTSRDGVKALLFNEKLRYLTEVIDDPLTVDRLCSAGRRCEPPSAMALDAMLPPTIAADREILCFALGGY